MPAKRVRHLFLPELIEPVARPWTVEKVELEQASVDTEHRHARVPVSYTEAQILGTMHEGLHVKYSPSPDQPNGNWIDTWLRTVKRVQSYGIEPDLQAVERLSKMMEENRVDWLGWLHHTHPITGEPLDTRPVRETLNWSLQPDAKDLLDATCIVLQLAWTVWVSRGIGFKHIENMPPSREPDLETGEFFDKAWAYVYDENRDLAIIITAALKTLYQKPTDEMRELTAAELARFFPAKKPEEPPPPPLKPEEKQAREDGERKQQEQEKAEEESETGAAGGIEQRGHYQIHDHTANIRRPSLRIARRHVPIAQGLDMRYANRYYGDKAIFSRRLLNEAGIMIDGSGSMNWTDDDLKLTVEKLPAVKVGIYSGLSGGKDTHGRICIIAKNGRFAKFLGKDPGTNDGNVVDYEALQLLARWPKPRLWLSDGMVCGGIHRGPPEHHELSDAYARWGKLHEMCDAFMKRNEILRVPDLETLHALLRRQRVTLYRTTRPAENTRYGESEYWPNDVRPEPVSYQL